MSTHNKTAEFSIPLNFKTNLKTPVSWVFSHALVQWKYILVATLGAVGNAALASLPVVLIGRVFDEILKTNTDMKLIGQYAVIIVASQLIRALIMFVRNYGFEIVAQKIEKNIRQELYINLLGKSMTFHNLQTVGDIMARATNDVREVNYLFSPGVNLVIGSLNFLIMPLILSVQYHPTLIITPLLFVLFYFISLRYYLKTLLPITDDVRNSFGNLNSRLAESLDGIETVKAASQEDYEVCHFGININQYKQAMIRQGDVEARFIPYLLLGIASAAGLFHAIYLSTTGAIGSGDVVAYFGLLSLLSFPTFVSLFAYSQISVGISSARRIIDMIKRRSDLDQNLEGYQGDIKGTIEFKNLEFAYPESDPSLEAISFSVQPGQTVAVVGQTGSGKTTLVKMINRTFDATKGSVSVDGIDVRDWNLAALRKQISIIEQDIFLFSQSIKENIAFGKPDAGEERVKKVAEDAQVDEFIHQFENGYETVLGDRGVTLSGGQRQRIALARAFLTDPRILILDDSTSAIDSETEDKIQKAIFKAAEGRTTFIITHRLSQIRWADLIIVMKKGKIDAVGSHEQLMNESQAYRQIFTEID